MIRYKTYLTLLFLSLTGLVVGQTDSTRCQLSVDSLTGKTIYIFVDQMPEPIGGMKMLMDSISKNLVIPTHTCVAGKIYVGFIVNTDGTITGKRILKDPVEKDMARQVLENIDKVVWIPGKCKGIKVPVFMSFPIIIDYK